MFFNISCKNVNDFICESVCCLLFIVNQDYRSMKPKCRLSLVGSIIIIKISKTSLVIDSFIYGKMKSL